MPYHSFLSFLMLSCIQHPHKQIAKTESPWLGFTSKAPDLFPFPNFPIPTRSPHHIFNTACKLIDETEPHVLILSYYIV